MLNFARKSCICSKKVGRLKSPRFRRACFNRSNFEFYYLGFSCFSLEGINKVQCSFSIGMEFKGIFPIEDKLGAGS